MTAAEYFKRVVIQHGFRFIATDLSGKLRAASEDAVSAEYFAAVKAGMKDYVILQVIKVSQAPKGNRNRNRRKR